MDLRFEKYHLPLFSTETANLVSIMWSFAWRGCSDEVQQMSVSVMDELPHLSAETQVGLLRQAKACVSTVNVLELSTLGDGQGEAASPSICL